MKMSLVGQPITTGIMDDDDVLLGFDGMTDDEIIYTMGQTPYPEYMGSKLKNWFRRRRKRARSVISKMKRRFKRMPKWAKIATGVIAAPVAAAALPYATAAATGAMARRLIRKRKSNRRAAAKGRQVAVVRNKRAHLMNKRRARMAKTHRYLRR